MKKGIGDHVYDDKTLQCIFDRLKVNYSIFFSVFAVFIPCCGIAYCYVRIFWYSYRSKKKAVYTKSSIANRNIRAIRIAKSLFVSFFLFAICW